jgi:FkbM family methyltransferase
VTQRSYALNEIDRQLDSILQMRNGFFIEAGANDGKAQSNTLMLERRRGWKGLLIEPVPELFKKCSDYRFDCHVVQAALVPLGYSKDSIEINCCGLMSSVNRAMKSDEATAQHIAIGASEQKLQPYVSNVPARTLSDILDELQVKKVDLLSLDVEGFEADALRGIDFNRHAPTYILVEERFPEDVRNVLSPYYDSMCMLSHHDRLYVRRDED